MPGSRRRGRWRVSIAGSWRTGSHENNLAREPCRELHSLSLTRWLAAKSRLCSNYQNRTATMNKEHVSAQLLVRSWPFPRGSGRIIDRVFSNIKFSEQIASVMTTDGFKMLVPPNDHIGRHIY